MAIKTMYKITAFAPTERGERCDTKQHITLKRCTQEFNEMVESGVYTELYLTRHDVIDGKEQLPKFIKEFPKCKDEIAIY